MDQLLLRNGHIEQGVAIGRHLAKADVDGEDRVGVADQGAHVRRHADARLAAIDGREIVELVLIAEGRDDGDVGGFGEGLQRVAAFGRPVATPDQNDGALCGAQHVQRFGNGIGGGRGFRQPGRSSQRCSGGEACQHVFGQGDDDRARPPGKGGGPGARQDFGDAVDMVDLDRPFRDGAEHGAIVDFLKCLAAAHVGSDLPDEDKHRGAVLHGGMDADGGIGGPGAARDHAKAGLACQLAPGGGHEGRTAFVPAEDEIQLARRIMQGVQHREVAFARNAKSPGCPEGDEGLNQKLPAVLHVLHPFPRIVAGILPPSLPILAAGWVRKKSSNPCDRQVYLADQAGLRMATARSWARNHRRPEARRSSAAKSISARILRGRTRPSR